MENETQIEQNAQDNIKSKNAVEERMQKLANDKVEAESKAKTESEGRIAAEKEASFYKGFSGSISKYPQANEYQDAIKEKVMSGYDIEDATVAVLAKEGKLTTPTQERQSPAGGSASNQIQSKGGKSVAEMSREERREALKEAEARGDLSNQ